MGGVNRSGTDLLAENIFQQRNWLKSQLCSQNPSFRSIFTQSALMITNDSKSANIVNV